MNTKSFAIGFATMDSVIAAGSAAKRGIVHGAQATKNGAQATKNGALNTSEAVTSFFAGAKQAVKCRRGTCRMITLTHDMHPAPEIHALTHDVHPTPKILALTHDARSNEE